MTEWMLAMSLSSENFLTRTLSNFPTDESSWLIRY